MDFNVYQFRDFFPQLKRTIGPKPMIYFDNGASTLKHNWVIDRIHTYNRFETSNVHRATHQISRQGTENYEEARKKLQRFIHARYPEEVIFTRGTTESINLVAGSLGSQLTKGDEILISPLEHHSNIVPWQILCEKQGCQLKVAAFDPKKGLCPRSFENSLCEKTKLVSLILHSNSFGNRLPVEELIGQCKKRGIFTLVDAAQTPLGETMNVQELGCDFLAFSGHKMYGPYGIGVLFGRLEVLESMPPYQSGGSMIDRVSFERTTYAQVPQKFEAGTPNVAGAIGLGIAADFIKSQNIVEQHQYILNLREYLKKGLMEFDSIQVHEFQADDHTGIVSFNLKGAHPSDVGILLDKYGIAVRSGHHCNQPLMELMGIPGTVRVSLAPYNTKEEVDSFLRIMKKVEDFFQ